MARVFVSIGSNIDPEGNVRDALDALAAHYGSLTLSPVYRSAAVGFEGDDFLNLVVAFDSDDPPPVIARRLRSIEDRFGRRRGGPKFSSRTLDLDILLCGDAVGDWDGLILPRREITRHAFVLRPLADLAADDRHPLLKLTYRQLWQRFDAPDQRLWPVDFHWRGRRVSTSGGE